MKRSSFALLFITTLACSQPKNAPEFLPEKLAELKGKTLEEVSGLASSIANPGTLWAHNDSQQAPSIYLINDKLDILLTCTLQGVGNRDWEDITIGPGPEPGKHYLYVAEIGDNLAQFPLKYIYRFEEPLYHAGDSVITITQFDRITFRLPHKQKDTEALMIDPKTKSLFIVSKREKPVHLYELSYPYSLTDTITATEVMPLPLTQIVAADISADGNEILMKNYNQVYYWNNDAEKPVTEVLQATPVIIPYKEEPQGESITWARDGSGFYTLSEKNPGKKSFLYFYKRK